MAIVIRRSWVVDFYKLLAARGFYPGPPWFIWVLLYFGVILALVAWPLQSWIPKAGRLMTRLRDRPVLTFAVVFVLAAIAFLPLLSRFGFGAWVGFPFIIQISRSGIYSLWFVFGFLVGVPGVAEGLLARDGALARHYCIGSPDVSWPITLCGLFPNGLRCIDSRLLEQGAVWACLWVLSCVASCFGFLALFRHMETVAPWMNSLTRCA